MKGQRTDLEVKGEIIARLIKGELGSVIAKDLGVTEATVSRIKTGDLQEVVSESNIISKIIKNDMETVKNMSEIAKKYTENLKAKEEIDRADISVANQTTESAFKRSQLLQGKTTENSKITIEWSI